MNTIQIKGNIGSVEPLKYTGGGMALLSFSVADSSGKGEKKTTQWWRVNLWGEMAEGNVDRVQKGLACEVTGWAKIRTYQKKDGTTGVSPEVVAQKILFGSDVVWSKNQPQDDYGPAL